MPHEHNKRLIEKLIDLLAEELNINIKSVGSMICKREDLQRGRINQIVILAGEETEILIDSNGEWEYQ